MEVRRLVLGDDAELAAAVAVQRAAYELEAALIGTRNIPGLREGVTELREAGAVEALWGAFDGGRLVGVMGLEDEAALDGSPCLRIGRLVVDPAWFRRGVGRGLVRHAVAMGNGRRVRVSTGAANGPGCALYASEGFVVIEKFSAPDGTGLVMFAR